MSAVLTLGFSHASYSLVSLQVTAGQGVPQVLEIQPETPSWIVPLIGPAARRAFVAGAVRCTPTGVPHTGGRHSPSLVLSRQTSRT